MKQFLICLLLLLPFQLFSQGRIVVYGPDFGLPTHIVRDIIQDDFGWIWVATDLGIFRFDGYKFQALSAIFPDAKEWESHPVLQLKKSVDQTLWAVTEFGGIAQFSVEKSSWKIFTPQNKLLPIDHVRSLTISPTHEIYISTWGKGIWKLIDGKFSQTPHTENMTDGFIKELIFHEQGQEIILTRNQVYVKSKNEWKSNDGLKILKDPNSTIELAYMKNYWWLSTREGLFATPDLTQPFKKLKVIDQNKKEVTGLITVLLEDNQTTINIGFLDKGLWEVTDFNFLQQQVIISQTPELTDLSISSLLQNDPNLLWIGTRNKGLIKVVKKENPFAWVPVNLEKLNITSICVIGDDNYLVVLDKKEVFYFQSGKLAKIDIPKNHTIHRIKIVDQYFMIFTTTGLLIGQKIGDTFSVKELNVPGLIRHSFLDGIMTTDGWLWLSTGQSLVAFNNERQLVAEYFYTPGNQISISKNDVAQLLQTQDGRLWISFNSGGCNLISVNYVTSTGIPTIQAVEDFSSTEVSEINKLQIQTWLEDSRGDIWIGTLKGVYKYHSMFQQFEFMTKNENSKVSTITSITEDHFQNLWATTTSGLLHISKRLNSGQPYNYNHFEKSDGLPIDEFIEQSISTTITGKIITGGKKGFLIFSPKEIVYDESNYPIRFTEYLQFNSSVPIRYNDKQLPIVSVKYQTNVLTFFVAALDFQNTNKLEYAFQLEGFNQEKIFTGPLNYITFTNLDPGNYTLKVHATNHHGIWMTNPLSLPIEIIPPIYMTWWFRLLIMISFVAIILIYYRIRLQRLIEMERLRIKIASDLHDDVGATLTKVSMHADLLRHEVDEKEREQQLLKIAEQSRSVVRTMSDIVWSIDARNDTLGNLIDRVQVLGESLLQPLNIEFHFEKKGINSELELNAMIRQNIYLIIKETMNNSVKYAFPSLIKLQLHQDKRRLSVFISDNGKGFDIEQVRKGHGLKNMKLRAQQIHSELKLQSDESGTRIIFEVTLK